MRALIQRVSEARVVVAGSTVGQIDAGLLVFVGVSRNDAAIDAEYLARKICNLRIFPDNDGKMNLSVIDKSWELLVVSQFTLYAELRKGNRPSYSEAAAADEAKALYESFVDACRSHPLRVSTGVFQAHMEVHLVNDGPVTFLCSSDDHVRPIHLSNESREKIGTYAKNIHKGPEPRNTGSCPERA